MKRLIFVAFSALALSGCTGSHVKKLAVCDGKHRRPANSYGTTLPSLPLPVPASEAQAPPPASPLASPASPAGADVSSRKHGHARASTPPPPSQTDPAAPRTSWRMVPTHVASC